MKNILFLFFVFLSITVNAQNYPFYGGFGGFPGAGMGNGGSMGGGIGGNSGFNFQTSDQNSTPVFDNGLGSTNVQYRSVKVNDSCPLLTSVPKDDQDVFGDLKSFLSTASKSPNCSLSANPLTGASPQASVAFIEDMLNGDTPNSNTMGFGGQTNPGVRCYSKNVELISKRNLAYYYVEKEMSEQQSSPYAKCSFKLTISEKRDCITKTYEDLVEENTLVCKEVIAPQKIQKQVTKGLIEIEQILSQAISNKEACGFKSEDLFKVTMNTFLKTKALSVVGPWGMVAGFGAGLIGNLFDKLFPSDAQKAAALLDEILSEETFEQNACLYFNVQQKLYCENRPVEIQTPAPDCKAITVSSDLLMLIQKYKDVKKVTDSLSQGPSKSISSFASPGGDTEGKLTPEMEDALVSHIDDLAKYAVANEEHLQSRINSLPKIQQANEKNKLDNFLLRLKAYQSYDPAKDTSGQEGKKLIADIAAFFINKDPEKKLDLSMFIVKTTPGMKLETIKQRSIARTIEELMAVKESASVENESSRTMAKYNKYKKGMASLAKAKFETRLEKQFKEFETQVKFVSSRDKGIVNDSVAEGQLRNLVRHCTLLQEIYDPNLEGVIPRVCQKLSCKDANKLAWFKPQSDKANFSAFKENYCDKTLSYQKIEGEFVKELKNKTGAKICGVTAESFF